MSLKRENCRLTAVARWFDGVVDCGKINMEIFGNDKDFTGLTEAKPQPAA